MHTASVGVAVGMEQKEKPAEMGIIGLDRIRRAGEDKRVLRSLSYCRGVGGALKVPYSSGRTGDWIRPAG
jgi:hypothetical protein